MYQSVLKCLYIHQDRAEKLQTYLYTSCDMSARWMQTPNHCLGLSVLWITAEQVQSPSTPAGKGEEKIQL